VKARTVGVRPALGAVVGIEVVAIAAFASLPPHRFGWWPAATITAVVAIVLLVTVHRRNFTAWLAARVRWWRGRRYTTAVGAAIDVSHGGAVYGVRTAGNEAVTVVRVDGRVYAPTFLRGSTVSRTTNVLPLDVLIGLLDQPGGLRLGIDVVSTGYRVRPGSGYPQLYSTLLADRGAAGQRTTYLIVRLDIRESLRGLVYRHSIGSAAAAAAERIVKALQQEGFRSVALNAEEQDGVLDELGVGLATAPDRPSLPDEADVDDERSSRSGEFAAGELVRVGGRHSRTSTAIAVEPTAARRRVRAKADVGWSTINAKPGYVTSYYFSPEDITTESFHRMWSLRSDGVVHVLVLRKQRSSVVVSALVRTNDPRTPERPPTLFLNPLPGAQYAATLRAAPTSQPRLELPARALQRHELEIPIGPTGVLVGSALRDDKSGWPEIQRDDLVMWALTDPQQPTRITMDTSDFYVRQLLIRAAAAGERIAVYSDHPERWYSVSQPNVAVVEHGRRAEFVPTIIVNDHLRVAPSVGLSSTVITVGHSPADAVPDMFFEQTSPSTVRISAARQSPLDVAIVVFRQEETFTGT
jgi:type VII secretion protein EccE